MADRLDRLGEAPAFNAAAHSDALNQKLGKGNPARQGDPFLAFQKESPESLPPFVRYVRGALRDKINALVEFTADLKGQQDQNSTALVNQDARLDAVEAQLAAQPRPFP